MGLRARRHSKATNRRRVYSSDGEAPRPTVQTDHVQPVEMKDNEEATV